MDSWYIIEIWINLNSMYEFLKDLIGINNKLF